MFSRLSRNAFKACNYCSEQYYFSSVHRPLWSLIFTHMHDEMRQRVNKIIDKDINPHVDKWEKDGQYPAKEIFKKLAGAGLLGITRSPAYGGLGLDYTFTVAFFEELGNINSADIPMSIAVHTDMSTQALDRYGSEELKQEFLKPSISGDVVSCVGIREEHCGSDFASIKTKAVRKGDDLIINGSKMGVKNGPQADWMCMLANTNDGPLHRNKSLICVPLNLPGISYNRIYKLGTLSSDTAQFFFKDVRVPAKNIIGEEGIGFSYWELQIEEEKLAALLGIPTILDRTIQQAIQYCKDWVSKMGQRYDPWGANRIQFIHHTLKDLQTQVEALRTLLHQTTVKMLEVRDITLLVTMAKLNAVYLVREVSDICRQLSGSGYTADALVTRQHKRAALLTSHNIEDSYIYSIITDGSDEIMLGINSMLHFLKQSKAS